MGANAIERVLRFWLGELPDHGTPPPEDRQRSWFGGGRAFDERVRRELGGEVERALSGELDGWAETPRGALALVILLDQLTRNVFRGTPRAYRGDSKALQVARSVIARGDDESLHPVERAFLYMPFMHAEDPDVQERSVEMFRALAEASPKPLQPLLGTFHRHARAHRDEIARFGRFPARNVVLDRTTTPQELEFLKRGRE
ncbi:MAG: DUF924 family protein [Myxococcota bacterium]